MYLPETRDIAGYMLHHLVFFQSRIDELPFLVQIVLQGHAYFLPSGIHHAVVLQHPFFLRNVILSELSCVFEHPFKNGTMDGSETCHAIGERIGHQQFRDVGRHLVGFLFVGIAGVMRGFSDVILFDKIPSLVDGDFAFDIPAGGLLQVFRRRQPVNGLQTDSHAPCISTLALRRLPLADILVEIDILLVAHTEARKKINTSGPLGPTLAGY